MRWTAEDGEKFESAKQYVDTALIPIFSFSIEEVGLDVIKEQKWLEEVCVYAERQLTGRSLLFPTLYLLEEDWLPSSEENNSQFPYRQYVTTNPALEEKLRENGLSVYLLKRKETEEELAEMVKEGKKLTNYIMERWKESAL